MALQPEFWIPDLVENLYQGNEFMNASVNHDSYVTNGRAVHVPQAGQPSGVQVNRTTLPATISQRTDTEIVYTMDELTTDPVFIPNIDEVQLNYRKRESIIMNDAATLRDVAATSILSRWTATLPASSILRHSGTTTRNSSIAGAAGPRKRCTKEELYAAKVILDRQLMPSTGRMFLATSEQIDDLLRDKDLAVNFVQYANIAEGVVGRVAGFAIMMRPTVLRFDNAATPVLKSPSSAVAATDNAGGFCWHPSVVAKAQGDVKMFERIGDPTLYGNVYSFLVMLGGKQLRADGKGIVAIVEQP
jgi:hypothetical protein